MQVNGSFLKTIIKTILEVTTHNILNRKSKKSPNRKWLIDLTEFNLKTGNKVFLSAVYDLGSNTIISYELNNSNNNRLVFNTPVMVLN